MATPRVAAQVVADRKGATTGGAGEGPVLVVRSLMFLQIAPRGEQFAAATTQAVECLTYKIR